MDKTVENNQEQISIMFEKRLQIDKGLDSSGPTFDSEGHYHSYTIARLVFHPNSLSVNFREKMEEHIKQCPNCADTKESAESFAEFVSS